MVWEQTTDGNAASTSSLTLPKKGILKRSCSHSGGFSNDVFDRRSNRILSLRLFRPSSDRFPEKKASRIPKLSLTWSEKNAVAIFGDTTSDENLDEPDEKPSTSNEVELQNDVTHSKEFGPLRQTDILSDSDETDSAFGKASDNYKENDKDDDLPDVDCQSVTSTGSSHITGKWWFGKSTRFVPHCAKRGCANHNNPEDVYMTPTQRYIAQIRSLRKQLKTTMDQLAEKEAHLTRLKARLNELENMIDSSWTAREEQRRLKLEHQQLSDELDSEREQQELTKRGSTDSPTQAVKMFLALEESKCRRASLEKETMTDVAFGVDHPNVMPMSTSPPAMPPPSPSTDLIQNLSSVPHEIIVQLQAYQNEIAAWRTKAVHLQSLLKKNITRSQLPEPSSPIDGQVPDGKRLLSARWSIDESRLGGHFATLPVGKVKVTKGFNECHSIKCDEIKEKLKRQNQQLKLEVESKAEELHEVDEKVKAVKAEMVQLKNENQENLNSLQNIKNESEQSTAEVQAANLSILRLQEEVATKTKAINYLEERSQAYRNIIIDHDLTVPDEATDNWWRGFSDPRFTANPSKKVQTQLTADDLSHKELHLHDLKHKFKVLEEELSTKAHNFKGIVREAEENLSAKNQLVELLTEELEKTKKNLSEMLEKHRKEKSKLQTKIAELQKVADRVPVLETELEKLQQEKSLMQLRMQDAKDEFDAGLENSLSETLKKYHQQSSYWNEKMTAANETNEALRAKITVLERELEELRLRMKVEKADMSQRLTSSFKKVDHLRSQITRPTRDVEIEVAPHTSSKYVTCRPNIKHRGTSIKKGDLFDEMEERLKLCQGELCATRRQVEVLQQKLVDTVQTQADDQKAQLPLQAIIRDAQKKDKAIEASCNTEHGDEIEMLKEKIDQLEQQNYELTSKLSQAEDEKWNVELTKRQHIGQLAAEFEGVRKELDQEISRYESERCRLKNRIKILTKAKLERDWLIQRLRRNQISRLEKKDVTPLTRCLSLPHLRKNSTADELQTARACNSILTQVNANLNKELMLVRRLIETSIQSNVFQMDDALKTTTDSTSFSPDFKDLASDLNQVRRDLENIILQIDKGGSGQDTLKSSDSESLTISEEDKRELRMENDLERLRKALKRSWADREVLSKQLDRITAEFRERSIKPDPKKDFLRRPYVYNERPPIMRSRSFAGLAKWWSEQAQASFRISTGEQGESIDNETLDPSAFVALREPDYVNKTALNPRKLSRAASWHFAKEPFANSEAVKKGALKSRSLSLSVIEGGAARSLNGRQVDEYGPTSSAAQSEESREKHRAILHRLRLFAGKETTENAGTTDSTEDIEVVKRENENLKNENLRLTKLKNARICDLKNKITVLSEQNEVLAKKLDEIEKERQEMYLIMFKKGRQAAEHDIEEMHAFDELTEHHVVLKFLHDAFYYYLLNKGDAREHLQVIMAMLNFTQQQRDDVLRRRGVSH